MKKIALAFIIVFIGASLQAQIPNGYYDNAEGKTGDELKIALHNIIKDHTVVSYSGLLVAYAYTDCDSDGKIWDIYSNKRWSLSNNCGSYSEEGDCWNREHTWPQSWFNEKAGPKSDLFHVMPTDGYVNNRRSNYPYGEVSNPTYTSNNGSKLGKCTTTGYSGTVFEPVDEYKGDIARNFFYMSVRYYNEDSGWGSSGMTNKSTILDWAMDMLLRWHEADPVSVKEIARNNAVYGYQGNRNPFIDHPEYAPMIWVENWEASTSYNITCATDLSNGSVSAPERAAEGTTVAITATPDAGYMVSSYTVYKTGSSSTTINVSSNGTFTMPGYDVTVSATFTQNNTYYAITAGAVTHGSITVSSTSALSGSTITMTATPESGYELYSWYVYKTGDMNTNVYTGTNNSFTMPAFNVTVIATFTTEGSSTNGDYVKVTEALDDWSGEYLIVCEDQNVAFNGTVEDNWGRCSAVTISNATIESTETTDAFAVTISKSGSGYTFLFPDGKYMSWKGEKKFSENTTAVVYSISISSGNVSIAYGDNILKYNHNDGNGGLRSYLSGQTAIQLYKRVSSTTTPTHTIYFEPNGGTGSMSEQTVEEYVATTLNTNTFTRDAFEFDGWNTEANGEGTYYADNASVTLTADLTLYAQWNPKYSITIAETENGTITASETLALAEATITLTATPATGYELGHYTVTDGNGNNIEVVENQFEMPADNVTVSATFVYVGAPFEQKYYLVTSTDQLVAGRTYLIVNVTNNKALSKTQNNNNRSATAVSISNNTIESIDSDVCELTLGGSSGAWTFFDANYGSTGGYLYAASSSNNYLKTQATNDDNGKWTISISNGEATLTAQGTNTHKSLRYNSNNSIFSCYATTADLTQMPLVSLFIRSEEYNHTEDETLANIFYFDKHRVRSGATLTVNGTITSTDVDKLVLEDGAQLVHHNDAVKATVKKSINAYTTDGGWYTIALPFTSITSHNEFVTTDYDLYAYDEDAPLEWINYKSAPFTIAAGNGYLYAHNPATDVVFQGTLNNGDATQTVDLSYANTHDDIKGFNLVGNPTAHDIQFSKSENVSDGYYYIDNGSNWTYEPSNSIPMARGALVKANANEQTVTLNTQNRGNQTTEQDYIHISIDDESTYIKTSEGVSMPTISFNGKSSQLYLNRDDKSYVMLTRDDAEVVELCYKPNDNATHSFSAEADPKTTPYLHLFDKKTGTDIDLLRQPDYQFQSETGDYASRFQLRFTKAKDTDEPFAYYADQAIVIDESVLESRQDLRLIDTTGRVVMESAAKNVIPTTGIATGIYILRLSSSKQVRIQKIAIEN